MQKEKISIIIPVFNPSGDWFFPFPDSLNLLQKTFPDYNFELIFVDDGSTRPLILKEQFPFSVKLITHSHNKGKGAALRTGLQNAESRFFILTDIDLPYTTESMVRLIRQMENDRDVVFGYREKSEFKKSPLPRRIISGIYGWWVKNILRYPVGDTQCGIKGMNEKGKEIFLKTTTKTFLYDLEFMKLVLKNKNINYDFLTVQLREGIQFSKMNVKVLLREWMNMLKIIFRSGSK